MRYGLHTLCLEAFLGSLESATSGFYSLVSALSFGLWDLPHKPAYCLSPASPTAGLPILLRPSITRVCKYANINAFPISYALQPRLRGRLTLGRLPLPRKPRVSGERVFHPFYRYSCQHYHFSTVQHAFQHAFSPVKNAPLPLRLRRIQSFGSSLSPVTFSAQRH